MQFQTLNNKSYKLHFIKTEKFKTIFFKVTFWKPIDKEEITLRNLLIENLVFSCLKYPSKKKMTIHKQDLYGCEVTGYNKRIGNYIYTEIYMSLLNPIYTEGGMLKESFAFLKEILFNPNVENGAFNKKIFDIIKQNAKDEINKMRENPDALAFKLLKEEVSKEKAFSYNLEGSLEDLEKIDEKNLYEYYKRFLKENYVNIFVVGDINKKEIQSYIDENFEFEGENNYTIPLDIAYSNSKRTINEVVKDSKFNQSKILIACNIDKLSDYEKKYPLVLYNTILGNSAESKFFKNVREKLSFAYSINSSFRKYDDLLYISAGISYKNYEKVKDAIKHELEEMRLGNFDMDDMEKAKQLYTSVLKDTLEYPSSIADYVYARDYLDCDSVDEQTKMMEKVSKEEIIKVAESITIDTILLLKGADDGDN